MERWTTDVAGQRTPDSKIRRPTACQRSRRSGVTGFRSTIVVPLVSAFVVLLFCSSRLASARGSAGHATPSVLNFSPQGSVKQVRQVTARFSEPMVPLGDPRASLLPFEIECDAKGAARWIVSFTWSYDFAQDLQAGVRCRFKLRGGFKTLSGASFATTPTFEFDTGGPSIVEARPWAGDDTIDEQQAFILMLDTVPDAATVTEHASFSVEGLPERVGVRIIRGAERDLLARRFERAIGKRSFVILEATQRFANGAAVHLIWGRGIRSSTGVANREDQQVDYQVRRAFAAKVDCER